MTRPPRLPDADDWSAARPVYVVWELTLACDQRCGHCGSRAGRKRRDELTLEECLRVVDQLAELGTREITLIGGEAYLRPDWVEVVRAISARGILCTMQTGGRGLHEARLDAAVDAGLRSLGEDYTAGNVRERPIAELWQGSDGARYLRTRTIEDLWGFCRTCDYAADCLAGCAWVSHSFLGRPGNNPYCHHRALSLHQQGLRERVERVGAPPGEPFDLGDFVLLVEPANRSGPAEVQAPPPWSTRGRRSYNCEGPCVASRADAEKAAVDAVRAARERGGRRLTA